MREPTPLRQQQRTRMLVYGAPGAGKTRFAASGERTLIIRPPTDHTDSVPLPNDAEEIEVEDHNQLFEAFHALQQKQWGPYEWVWLDSISLFEEWGLDDVFQAAIDRQPHRAEYGPDKGEYGINRGRLMKWVRDMVGVSKTGAFNFGVTANVFEIRDPVKEEDLWVPMVGSPSNPLSFKLCGYMNVVAYMEASEKEGKKRQEVLTVDSDGFIGKDQYQAFPKLSSGRHGFVNPTMADVQGAIDGARRPVRKQRAAKTKAPARKRTRRTTK